MPESLAVLVDQSPMDHDPTQSDVSCKLTDTNDNAPRRSHKDDERPFYATMAEKEAVLIALGKEANIEFTFVD